MDRNTQIEEINHHRLSSQSTMEFTRSAAERSRNNDRIIQFNQRAMKHNAQNPHLPPVKLINFENHLLRQAGFFKAVETITRLTRNTDNVVSINSRNRA